MKNKTKCALVCAILAVPCFIAAEQVSYTIPLITPNIASPDWCFDCSKYANVVRETIEETKKLEPKKEKETKKDVDGATKRKM